MSEPQMVQLKSQRKNTFRSFESLETKWESVEMFCFFPQIKTRRFTPNLSFEESMAMIDMLLRFFQCLEPRSMTPQTAIT